MSNELAAQVTRVDRRAEIPISAKRPLPAGVPPNHSPAAPHQCVTAAECAPPARSAASSQRSVRDSLHVPPFSGAVPMVRVAPERRPASRRAP